MEKKHHFIVFFNILFLSLFIYGCSNDEPKESKMVKEKLDGFEVSLEATSISNNQISIQTKLKYIGEEEIRIEHSKPLVSISTSEDGNERSAAHFFDDVGISKKLVKDEEYTFDEPIIMSRKQKGRQTVTALAKFNANTKKYSIPITLILAGE